MKQLFFFFFATKSKVRDYCADFTSKFKSWFLYIQKEFLAYLLNLLWTSEWSIFKIDTREPLYDGLGKIVFFFYVQIGFITIS